MHFKTNVKMHTYTYFCVKLTLKSNLTSKLKYFKNMLKKKVWETKVLNIKTVVQMFPNNYYFSKDWDNK